MYDLKASELVKIKGSRSLWVLLVLLGAAVVVPTVGLIWFMSQAVGNERAAVREKLVEVYAGQADEAVGEFELGWDVRVAEWKGMVEGHGLGVSWADVHERLGVGEYGSYLGLVIFDGEGDLVYPVGKGVELEPELPGAFYGAWELEFEQGDLAGAIGEYEKVAAVTNGYVKGRALLAMARCERKRENVVGAMEICREMVGDTGLGRTEAARGLQVNGRIMLVELAREEELEGWEEELGRLGEMVFDFRLSLDMRMFVWGKYKELEGPEDWGGMNLGCGWSGSWRRSGSRCQWRRVGRNWRRYLIGRAGQ